jgi:ubiquitin-conjugating enzyme E2 O
MPQERVARIRFFDEGELLPKVEEISLYDLNSHPILQYSLGDHVLIRSKLLPPGGVVDEVISLATGLVQRVVRSVRAGDDQPSGHQRQSSVNTEAVDWMGEVVKINTDGTVKVRLAREADPPPEWPGERFVTVKAEDVIVFEGDSDEEEDDLPIFDSDDWIDDDEGFDEEEDEEIENENENENENEQDNHNSEDEWEDASSASDEIPEASLDAMSDVEQAEHAQPVTVNGHIEPEWTQMDSVEPVAIQETAVEEPAIEPTTQDERYPRFDILESVPSDHPFKSDNPRRSGGEWLARIRREHRILQSSLPGTRST